LTALIGCRSEADPDAQSASAPAPMPLARTEVAGTQWRGDIVVVGGLTKDGQASARADRYIPTSNSWVRLPDLPVALHHAAATEFLARVFVIGGYVIAGGQWRESARVFSLGVNESAWREEPPLPSARGAHAAVAPRNRLIVMGGVVQGQVSASTVTFEPGAGWQAGPNLRVAREHLAATAHRDRVYAIAGRASGRNFTDVESWDGRPSEWREEPSLNDSRGGIGATTVSGRVCVAGGEETGGTIASVECLRASGWERAARLRAPRHGLAVVGLGQKLHVVGGGEQPGLFVSRVHEVLTIR
jgi:serine/threonine-protein kinase PknK